MKTTIKSVLRGNYTPAASFIEKDGKKIVFLDKDNKTGTIKCYIHGSTKYGRFATWLVVSFELLNDPIFPELAIKQWENRLKADINNDTTWNNITK